MNAYDDVICGISYFILSTLTFIQISNYSQKICDNTILKKHSNTDMNSSSESAYMQLIGNTPLIELKSLSKLTNCRILVKVESANPGGSGKDRASKSMVMEAIKHDLIKQNPMDNYYHVFEGSSGSTGISLAHIIQSISTPKKQYKMHVVLPDDQSKEKKDILEKLNVDVCVVPTCSISNPNHYVNKARQLAIEYNGYFINQFENLHNYKVHYEETGPEIIRQVSNLNSKSSDSSTVSDNIHHNKIAKIDGFVMSAGTGGTIAGIAKCLKEHAKKHNQACIVALADPNGSSLGNKINHGVCYTTQQQESKIRKHRYDSIVEGVGLDRITNNFKQALDYIDIAYTVSDQEILNMAHYVLQHEGILIGSSSALNLCVVIKLAKEHFNSKKQSPNDDPPTIVSILCDQGYRHISRFWNRDYITRPPYSLKWPDSSMDFDM